MVTKKLKEDVKIKISLQDYAIINNIPFMILEGFKTHLNCKLTDLQDITTVGVIRWTLAQSVFPHDKWCHNVIKYTATSQGDEQGQFWENSGKSVR